MTRTPILSHRQQLALLGRLAGLAAVGRLGFDEIDQAARLIAARARARGPSKLGRRLRRKQALGRAGAF